MNPTVATLLKRLSSFLKTGATSGRANGTPFTRWDRSHFERWTGAAGAERQAGTKSPAARPTAFQRWTQGPAPDAASGRKKAVRGSLHARAHQVNAIYYR